jgi:conjugative transfer signal peptidase TraF
MTGRMTTILATFGSVALVLAGSQNGAPSYIWNVSESVPIGLYRLQPVDRLSVTNLAAIRPLEPLETFLDLNGYLPVGVPMLKRILAFPGQTICRTGPTISVDDIEVGRARERDGRGRPLLVWQGCRLLSAGEIFVMNWQSEDSLDGRYFGPLPASAVIGKAMPVWTYEE